MRYWKRVDQNGNTITVESYSHDLEVSGAVEIRQAEFDNFIASLPVVEPEPFRNLPAEIDELETRVRNLEKRS